MKRLVFILIFFIFMSGCSNLKTPGEAIRQPSYIDTSISKSENVPLWSIRSTGERFFDTTFITNDIIATLTYKDGEIFLRTYNKENIIKEKSLGKKADFGIISHSYNRIVVKSGEEKITIYDQSLNSLFNFNLEKKNEYEKTYIDSIISPDGNTLVISVVYYKDLKPDYGEIFIYKRNKLVKMLDNIIPQLANFSSDSSEFLFLDLSYNNKGNNTFIYSQSGNMIKAMVMPIYLSFGEDTLTMPRVNAMLSKMGNAVLFSNQHGGGLYIKKFNKEEIFIPMSTEKFYTNSDLTKFIVGNYGVSKIYNNSGKLDDYIVINYGLINDVTFVNNNTYFAINGTTIPNSKGKDYVGVMDESGNMIWTAKAYDIVAMLRFSPDGSKIMSQSSKFISVYNYHNNKIDVIPRPINGQYPEQVWKRLFSDNIENRGFIITDNMGNIYISRNYTLTKATKNGNRYWIVETEKPIKFVNISNNGDLIMLVTEDKNGSEVIIYNNSGMVISHKYINKEHKVTSSAVSSDGKYFSYAVSTPENEIYKSFIDFFNEKGYMIWEQKTLSSKISNIDIGHNAITATFSDDRIAGYVALDFKGKLIFNTEAKIKMPYIGVSEDGSIFFTSKNKDACNIYLKKEDNKNIISTNTINGNILDVKFSKDGETIVVLSSYDEKSNYLTFFNDFEKVKVVTSNWYIVKTAITPDGNYIAVLSQEYGNVLNNANKITLYNKKGEVLYNYYNKSGIFDFSMTNDGTNLYLYCADGYVYKYKNK
ncbi:MAG: WD40 repeat domain-containing protein [Thermoanaerobacteraceae bacterium]